MWTGQFDDYTMVKLLHTFVKVVPLSLLFIGILGIFTTLTRTNIRDQTQSRNEHKCAVQPIGSSYFSSLSESRYQDITRDCDRFLCENGYRSHVSYQEELDFPIAFSILTYENVEQTERLLRLIYRPQNAYCIHVDAKSPPSMHAAMKAIADCFDPDTVFVASPPIRVIYATFSIVDAEMLCLRELTRRKPGWKYFVNLVGRDFPLRTNLELVRIFRAFNGSSDIYGSRHE